jgi:hypothetical protein
MLAFVRALTRTGFAGPAFRREDAQGKLDGPGSPENR